MIDLKIHNAMVLTMDGRDRVIDRGTILVQDGRLVAVCPTEPGDKVLPAKAAVDAAGMRY